jgi:hypothetical protein
MPDHPEERNAVHGREQFPVEKTGFTTGAERCYLAKRALTSAIPQPGVTREPADATQHQLARPDSGDPPPVHERTWRHGRGPASSKVFAHQAPEDNASHPPGRSSVLAID